MALAINHYCFVFFFEGIGLWLPFKFLLCLLMYLGCLPLLKSVLIINIFLSSH